MKKTFKNLFSLNMFDILRDDVVTTLYTLIGLIKMTNKVSISLYHSKIRLGIY